MVLQGDPSAGRVLLVVPGERGAEESALDGFDEAIGVHVQGAKLVEGGEGRAGRARFAQLLEARRETGIVRNSFGVSRYGNGGVHCVFLEEAPPRRRASPWPGGIRWRAPRR